MDKYFYLKGDGIMTDIKVTNETKGVNLIPGCGAELCYANMRHSYVIYKMG